MTKINIGCGKTNFGNDWIHIDRKTNYSHVVSDDTLLMDYKNDSVDVIYCSHMLEYEDWQEAKQTLTWWRDKLKPKTGILYLALPDFEALTDLYYKNVIDLERIIGPLFGRLINDDEIIYHRSCWDYSKLSEMLYEVGFTYWEKYNWKTEVLNGNLPDVDDCSRAYIPTIRECTNIQDYYNGHLISLNVKVFK